MAATTSWLSLTDLGRIYGISAIHCGKTLEHQGWRDRRGRPTQSALDANAAMQTGPHGQGRTVLWNHTVCSQLLEQKGYEPMSRSLQVEQWTQLLEALQVGSPSITETADQMAEEMPGELLDDVNHQLAVTRLPLPGQSTLIAPQFLVDPAAAGARQGPAGARWIGGSFGLQEGLPTGLSATSAAPGSCRPPATRPGLLR